MAKAKRTIANRIAWGALFTLVAAVGVVGIVVVAYVVKHRENFYLDDGRILEYETIDFHDHHGTVEFADINAPFEPIPPEWQSLAIKVPKFRPEPYLVSQLTKEDVSQFAVLQRTYEHHDGVIESWYEMKGAFFEFEDDRLVSIDIGEGSVLVARSPESRFLAFPLRPSVVKKEFGKPVRITKKRRKYI